MPYYANLEVDLHCLKCDSVVTDLLWFQWGYCPLSIPITTYYYHLGDPIQWKVCNDGSIIPWVYFKDEQGRARGANIGDPAIENLIVRDTYQFGWYPDSRVEPIHYNEDYTLYRSLDTPYVLPFDPSQPKKCRTCHEPIEGAAIEIREGIIQRAWIYLPGEFDNTVELYLIDSDGNLTPMPDWDDHPMPYVHVC